MKTMKTQDSEKRIEDLEKKLAQVQEMYHETAGRLRINTVSRKRVTRADIRSLREGEIMFDYKRKCLVMRISDSELWFICSGTINPDFGFPDGGETGVPESVDQPVETADQRWYQDGALIEPAATDIDVIGPFLKASQVTAGRVKLEWIGAFEPRWVPWGIWFCRDFQPINAPQKFRLEVKFFWMGTIDSVLFWQEGGGGTSDYVEIVAGMFTWTFDVLGANKVSMPAPGKNVWHILIVEFDGSNLGVGKLQWKIILDEVVQTLTDVVGGNSGATTSATAISIGGKCSVPILQLQPASKFDGVWRRLRCFTDINGTTIPPTYSTMVIDLSPDHLNGCEDLNAVAAGVMGAPFYVNPPGNPLLAIGGGASMESAWLVNLAYPGVQRYSFFQWRMLPVGGWNPPITAPYYPPSANAIRTMDGPTMPEKLV